MTFAAPLQMLIGFREPEAAINRRMNVAASGIFQKQRRD